MSKQYRVKFNDGTVASGIKADGFEINTHGQLVFFGSPTSTLVAAYAFWTAVEEEVK